MALLERTPASGEQTSTTSTHTCSLPGGLAVGDLLVVVFAIDTTTDAASTPAGWTLEEKGVNGGYSYVFSKVADSDDVMISSVDITTSFGVLSAYVSIGVENGQVESIPTASSGSGTAMAHLGYADPGEDAIFCCHANWGNLQPSPSLVSYPAGHTQTQKSETQANHALAVCTSPVTGTVPSNRTLTNSGGSSWWSGGLVITETGGGASLSAVATSTTVNDVSKNDLTSIEAVSTSTTVNDVSAVDIESVYTGTTIGGIEANPHTLETVATSSTLRTQFGCIRMIDGFITPIENASGPLCMLPPLNPSTSSFWGVVLREDTVVSFEADLVDSLVDLSAVKLSRKGDMIMFRFDSAGVFIQNKYPIGGGQFSVSNETESYSLDLSTASIADVGNFVQTLAKEIGYVE